MKHLATAAIAAGLAVALLAGCGKSSNHTASTTSSSAPSTSTTATTAVTSSTTASGAAGVNASANAQFANGRNPGYIHAVDTTNHTLTIDIIQFFTGDAANQASEQDGHGQAEDDYYIRNVNPAQYTFPIEPTAQFSVLASEPGSADDPTPKKVDFTTFANVITQHASQNRIEDNPFWITTSNGSVVNVEEQFRP